jgi:hypothetical protein
MSRARSLLVLCLAGLTAAGCGAAAPKRVIPAPVALRATVKPHPFSSATSERNRLLALARPGTKITSQGSISGWPPANGSGIPATATEISGFGFNVDKARKEQYLSFAVTDSRHGCAGGDIVTNSKGTNVVSSMPVNLTTHAPCTGDEVAKLAGHT